MPDYQIDLDSESVLVDGTWFTKDQLADKVKQMLGEQNFKIGTMGAALDALVADLSEMRDIGFRLTSSMLEQLETVAGKEGRSTSAILREALTAYFGSDDLPKRAEAGAAPVPVVADAPPVLKKEASDVTVEPASEEEAANAVPLTPKKKTGDGDKPAESNWFKNRS